MHANTVLFVSSLFRLLAQIAVTRVQELEQQRTFAAKEIADRNSHISVLMSRCEDLAKQSGGVEDRLIALQVENVDLKSRVCACIVSYSSVPRGT